MWSVLINEKSSVNEAHLRTKIKDVLELYRKGHHDIPFIITYRKNQYEPLLNKNDIWKIYDLDLEWNSFRTTKEALRTNLDGICALLPPIVQEHAL